MNNAGKIAIIVVGAVCILLLLRIGATIPASILGFILFLTALAERALRIYYMRQAAAARRYSAGASAKDAMSAEEAREMLEVGPEASEKEIKEAHHRLMLKVHPDKGGSKYMAAKLNEARDLLLKKDRK